MTERPELHRIRGSFIPGKRNIPHVHGPQAMPCDLTLAGLDYTDAQAEVIEEQVKAEAAGKPEKAEPKLQADDDSKPA